MSEGKGRGRGPRLGGMLAGTLTLVSAGACNFQIPDPSYIRAPKLLSAHGEVVELGPLNPDRVGVGPNPIAEPMPGDRYRFDMFVADGDGRPIEAEALDSLWFQCGVDTCIVRDERLGQRCDELEAWTLDEVCELGSGDGGFEFEIAEVGPEFLEIRSVGFFGIVGIEGRSARDCWAARRAGDELLEDCFFIHRPVKVGPSWWMLAYAESLGLESPIPLDQIPAPVYYQFANREPSLEVAVSIEGVLAGTYPEQTSFSVAPGQRIDLQLGYDESAQYLQSYFVVRTLDEDGQIYLFSARGEALTAQVFTSNNLHLSEPFEFFSAPIEVLVDEYAEPRLSRVLIVYRDDRYGEAVATLEFEVEGGA